MFFNIYQYVFCIINLGITNINIFQLLISTQVIQTLKTQEHIEKKFASNSNYN